MIALGAELDREYSFYTAQVQVCSERQNVICQIWVRPRLAIPETFFNALLMQAQQWVCVCLCVWCYHLRRNQQFNYLFLIVDKPGLKFLNSRKLETSCSLSFYLTWLILSLKTWKQNADTSIDVTRDEWFKHLRTEWTDDELLTPCINSNNTSVNQGSKKHWLLLDSLEDFFRK